MTTRLRLLLLVAALSACAHRTSFRCEARGGASWSEYRSRHFIVDTDAKPARAARLVELLETLQLLDLKALAGSDLELPGRLRVVALADAADFRQLAPSWTGAYFTLGRFGEPTIVIPLDAVDSDREVLAHELAHYVSRYLFPIQPLWFAEGLAEFVQTLAAPTPRPEQPPTGSHLARNAKVPPHSVGRIPADLQRWSPLIRPTPAAKLLAWRSGEDADVPGLEHASAWLLYHWLWNQRSPQLTDFETRLMDGDMPEQAWRAVFPQYDAAHPEALEALDSELDRYRRSMHFASYAVEGTADATFVEAPFPPAEAHLLLTSVRWNWPASPDGRRSLVEAEMAEALREDPRNPVALSYAPGPAKPDLQQIRAAAAQAPGDWRAWLLVSSVVEGAEKEAALRKAVQLNPDNATAQNALAWLLVTSDRTREALPIANRALDLAPWNPAIVDTLAEVAARLGRCPEALRLEVRAMAMRPADESLRKRQAEVQKRCPPG